MTEPTRYGVVNHPALKDLSPREKLKQIKRWRYHRQYQRKRYQLEIGCGDRWQIYWLIDQGVM